MEKQPPEHDIGIGRTVSGAFDAVVARAEAIEVI